MSINLEHHQDLTSEDVMKKLQITLWGLPSRGDYIPNPTCLAPADLLMNTCINNLNNQ